MYETRKKIIFNHLLKSGTATIAEFASLLGVSEMTVRRDVQAMDREGLIRKVHGGAVIKESGAAADRAEIPEIKSHAGAQEHSYAVRSVIELEKKRAIARESLRLLEEDAKAIYIDGSTTCAELAHLICPEEPLLVVTDSLHVVNEMQPRKNVTLLLLGGVLDSDGNTIDGILTIDNVRKVYVDICFMSAAGFSQDVVTNLSMTGSQVKQLMIRNAKKTVLLADSTKYGRRGIIRLCDLEEIDALVTDDGMPEAEAAPIRAKGVAVLRAEMPEGTLAY